MQILQEQISVHAIEKKVTKEGDPFATYFLRGKWEKYHPCVTSVNQ